MRKFAVALLMLLVCTGLALALSQSSVPPKFPIPWGNVAGAAYIKTIPQASQIGVVNCAASLTDGFPPLTFVPSSAGGCPPFGQDMNGVLKQITQWSQWQGAGASPLYDSSFSASISGYPSGARLANASTAGCFWVSTADNNASNPDSGGASWNSDCPGGGVGGTSTGSANTQAVAATPMALQAGAKLSFVAGFSNTGPLLVNMNGGGNLAVWRKSQLGASNTVGGEVTAGQLVVLQHDGTRWQCISCGIVTVGEIKDFAGTAAPNGWLIIDGSCQSSTTYADLSSVVVVGTYGTCSAGNFALPDGRGIVFAGKDTTGARLTAGLSGCNGNTLGTLCGAQTHTIAQGNLPSGALANSSATTTRSFCSPSNGACFNTNNSSNNFVTTGQNSGSTSSATGVTISALALGGSDTPFISVQPTGVVNKIIKL